MQLVAICKCSNSQGKVLLVLYELVYHIWSLLCYYMLGPVSSCLILTDAGKFKLKSFLVISWCPKHFQIFGSLSIKNIIIIIRILIIKISMKVIIIITIITMLPTSSDAERYRELSLAACARFFKHSYLVLS